MQENELRVKFIFLLIEEHPSHHKLGSVFYNFLTADFYIVTVDISI